MFEAKTELSRLVKALETKEEDVIFLARTGTPVDQNSGEEDFPENRCGGRKIHLS